MKKVRGLNLIMSLVVLALGSAAWAQKTCISNMADYNAKKSQLPSIFQNLPVAFTVDGFVTAAVKISPAGSKLKLEGGQSVFGSTQVDDSYVKQICYDGSGFQVTLESGKSYKAQLAGGAISIKGVTLNRTSIAKFNSIMNNLRGSGGGSSSRIASGSQ